jgi:CheY-like chemotaxis protein
LVLRIEDSGIGIRPDRLADLFHPFVQEDVSTTRRYGGTGLGLAISRRLAELMDGTITVDSTYGRGTVFTVQVLLGSYDGETTPSPTPLPAIGRPGTILLVEDHPVNQRVASLLLQRLGHRVLLAEDGQVALTVLSRERVDLVLMDCQMPVMDGFTATRSLRDPTSPVLDHHVPVIALTANALQGDREACLAAGMDDFLPKPLEATALMAILARWMGPQPRV